MNASGNRQGPMAVRTVKVVCDGCMYFEQGKTRGLGRFVVERFGCHHPDVKADSVDSRLIGYGNESALTPSWCPYPDKITARGG